MTKSRIVINSIMFLTIYGLICLFLYYMLIILMPIGDPQTWMEKTIIFIVNTPFNINSDKASIFNKIYFNAFFWTFSVGILILIFIKSIKSKK